MYGKLDTCEYTLQVNSRSMTKVILTKNMCVTVVITTPTMAQTALLPQADIDVLNLASDRLAS